MKHMHARRKLEPTSQPIGRPLPKKSLVLLKPDWSTAWRRVARATYGISGEDPRFGQVMKMLNACDEAYLANDWATFQRNAKLIVRLVGK